MVNFKPDENIIQTKIRNIMNEQTVEEKKRNSMKNDTRTQNSRPFSTIIFFHW